VGRKEKKRQADVGAFFVFCGYVIWPEWVIWPVFFEYLGRIFSVGLPMPAL
jgi:hypothetical protein